MDMYIRMYDELKRSEGVPKRREQQVVNRKESRTTEMIETEKQTNVKNAGRIERNSLPQKKTAGQEKKPSIHEHLEINKKMIQEKQGKDKAERGERTI